MKKNMFLAFGLLSCITGVTGLAVLAFTKDGNSMFLYFMAGTSASAAMMILFDPDNQKVMGLRTLVLMAIVAIGMMMLFSSCKTTGYGCKGKSRWITGHKPNGYGY